nr:hypothetical protein RVX_2729 [Nitratidesulfovibrio sp. HK-II]
MWFLVHQGSSLHAVSRLSSPRGPETCRERAQASGGGIAPDLTVSRSLCKGDASVRNSMCGHVICKFLRRFRIFRPCRATMHATGMRSAFKDSISPGERNEPTHFPPGDEREGSLCQDRAHRGQSSAHRIP